MIVFHCFVSSSFAIAFHIFSALMQMKWITEVAQNICFLTGDL